MWIARLNPSAPLIDICHCLDLIANDDVDCDAGKRDPVILDWKLCWRQREGRAMHDVLFQEWQPRLHTLLFLRAKTHFTTVTR